MKIAILVVLSLLLAESTSGKEIDHIYASASASTTEHFDPPLWSIPYDSHSGKTVATASILDFDDHTGPSALRASATATLGTLKVFTDASIPAHPDVNANAYSSDDISFSYLAGRTLPGLRPTRVRLKFSVSGDIDDIGDYRYKETDITLGWKSELDGSTVIGSSSGAYKYLTYSTSSPGTGIYSGTKPGVFSYYVPYNTVAGYSFKLRNELYCESNGGGICHGDHSFEWGGVELLDQYDQPMEGLEIASDSGFDYTRPTAGYLATAAVPEPSSWIMLMAGLGALGGVLRRRRWTSTFTLPANRFAA